MGLERLRDAKIHFLVAIRAKCTECNIELVVTLTAEDYELWCNGAPERFLSINAVEQRFLRTGRCKKCPKAT